MVRLGGSAWTRAETQGGGGKKTDEWFEAISLFTKKFRRSRQQWATAGNSCSRAFAAVAAAPAQSSLAPPEIKVEPKLFLLCFASFFFNQSLPSFPSSAPSLFLSSHPSPLYSLKLACITHRQDGGRRCQSGEEVLHGHAGMQLPVFPFRSLPPGHNALSTACAPHACLSGDVVQHAGSRRSCARSLPRTICEQELTSILPRASSSTF